MTCIATMVILNRKSGSVRVAGFASRGRPLLFGRYDLLRRAISAARHHVNLLANRERCELTTRSNSIEMRNSTHGVSSDTSV